MAPMIIKIMRDSLSRNFTLKLWGKLRALFEPGYRRSTLVLVAIQTALLTMLHTFLFISHEYSAAENNMAYEAKIVAELLSRNIRAPLFFENSNGAQKEIDAVLKNKEIGFVEVLRPDNTVFFSKPQHARTDGEISASANVVSQNFSPEDLITGAISEPVILGKVIVHMNRAERMKKSEALVLKVLLGGLAIWGIATYLGYLMMRRLTQSLTLLSNDMLEIERGESTAIDRAFRDKEISYLVGAINRLISSLDKREKANLALSQQLLKETKSQLKQTEDTMQKQMSQANRLASLGTMASYMAHEINNPVGTMILNLDLLKDAFEDSREIMADHYDSHGEFTLGGLDYHQYESTMPFLIDEMRNGAQKIKRIVDDLRRFATNESAALNEDIDINEAVTTALRLTSRKVSSSTEHLEINLTAPLPSVRGNMHQIEQVLINLILNACQALPDMSRKIQISTSTDLQGRHVLVAVKDEGEGVAAALIPHLTDPFFTTKREKGGTGIGLAISAKIIKDHGGTIDFNSDTGQGMVVTVSLPVIIEEDNG